MRVLDSLRFVTGHPLTRNARIAALARWFRWQVGSRLLPGPVVVPFVNDTRLIVSAGDEGRQSTRPMRFARAPHPTCWRRPLQREASGSQEMFSTIFGGDHAMVFGWIVQ